MSNLLKCISDESLDDSADQMIHSAYDLVEMASSVNVDGKSDSGIDSNVLLVSFTPDYVGWPGRSIETLVRSVILAEPDLERLCCVANATANLLRTEKFRKICIESQQVDYVFTLLQRSYLVGFDDEQLPDPDDADERNLQASRAALVQSLSEVSAEESFRDYYSPTSDLAIHVRDRLFEVAPGQTRLSTVACLILGNLIRCDDDSVEMITELGVLQHIENTRLSAPDFVFALLGLVKHLAIPVANKPVLASSKVPEMLVPLFGWVHAPQVRMLATTVMRRLIIAETVVRIVAVLNMPDPVEKDGASQRTLFDTILEIHGVEDLTQQIEAGRLAAQLCRALSTLTGGSAAQLYERYPNISKSIWVLTQQKENKYSQSEGWFAMALISTSAEGLRSVTRCMLDREEALESLLLEAGSADSALRDNLRILVNNLEHANLPRLQQELVEKTKNLLWTSGDQRALKI